MKQLVRVATAQIICLIQFYTSPPYQAATPEILAFCKYVLEIPCCSLHYFEAALCILPNIKLAENRRQLFQKLLETGQGTQTDDITFQGC